MSAWTRVHLLPGFCSSGLSLTGILQTLAEASTLLYSSSQNPDWQSVSSEQKRSTGHGLHSAPPQSMSVSSPLSTPAEGKLEGCWLSGAMRHQPACCWPASAGTAATTLPAGQTVNSCRDVTQHMRTVKAGGLLQRARQKAAGGVSMEACRLADIALHVHACPAAQPTYDEIAHATGRAVLALAVLR